MPSALPRPTPTWPFLSPTTMSTLHDRVRPPLCVFWTLLVRMIRSSRARSFGLIFVAIVTLSVSSAFRWRRRARRPGTALKLEARLAGGGRPERPRGRGRGSRRGRRPLSSMPFSRARCATRAPTALAASTLPPLPFRLPRRSGSTEPAAASVWPWCHPPAGRKCAGCCGRRPGGASGACRPHACARGGGAVRALRVESFHVTSCPFRRPCRSCRPCAGSTSPW